MCLLHVGVILGGASWYRYFGAGERLAQLAERGSPIPTAVTAAIAFVFLIWAAYAFSGAGLVRPLPFLAPVLVAIAAIYLLRGALLLPAIAGMQPLKAFLPTIKPNDAFTVWSSCISFAIGLLYAIGTSQIIRR